MIIPERREESVNSMKKVLALLLAMTMMFALAACGSASNPAETAAPAAEKPAEAEKPVEEAVPEEPVEETAAEEMELIVFAAASMTESLTEIKALYEAENPGITIVYNFDSSGTLKTQIQEGADCDIFISAAQKQMNALDSSKEGDANPDGLDFVLQGSRINLVRNTVALAVPEGNPKGIESFDQLADLLKEGDVFMAMGNEDVPVGQYTQEILAYYQLNEEELAAAGCLTYGSNVKEVTTQVAEGSVDCGVVYSTDAYSAGLEWVDVATKDMCKEVVYPAAVLNVSMHPEAAQAFLDYLTGEEAMAVLQSVGFAPAA